MSGKPNDFGKMSNASDKWRLIVHTFIQIDLGSHVLRSWPVSKIYYIKSSCLRTRKYRERFVIFRSFISCAKTKACALQCHSVKLRKWRKLPIIIVWINICSWFLWAFSIIAINHLYYYYLLFFIICLDLGHTQMAVLSMTI